VVAAASALIALGAVERAISLLEQELGRDEGRDRRQRVLQAQLARSLAEIGRVGVARSLAAGVQGLPTRAPDDLTASAIAGSAAAILFNTSGWGQRDLEEMVKGQDTVAGWWRTQMSASGLAAENERIFKDWASDQSVTFGGETSPTTGSSASALAEGHAPTRQPGDMRVRFVGETNCCALDRHSEPASAAAGLSTLRSPAWTRS